MLLLAPHVTWAVIVYFKCAGVSSVIQSPPPWGADEEHWHLGEFPDLCRDHVSHSQVGAAKEVDEEPVAVAVPPGLV